jgi:cobalt/nickel transport system permease protein
MHISDSLISIPIAFLFIFCSSYFIIFSFLALKKSPPKEGKFPLMFALGGGLVFIYLLAFPISFISASLGFSLAILFSTIIGNKPSFIMIFIVTVLTTLFFGNGGLAAIGINIFCFGVIPCFFIYPLIFRKLLYQSKGKTHHLFFAITAACLSSNIISCFTYIFCIYFSDITILKPLFLIITLMPLMIFMGIVEGLLSFAIIIFICQRKESIVFRSMKNENKKTYLYNFSGKANLNHISIILVISIGVLLAMLILISFFSPEKISFLGLNTINIPEISGVDPVQALKELQAKLMIFPDFQKIGNGREWSIPAILIGGILFLSSIIFSYLYSIIVKRRKK